MPLFAYYGTFDESLDIVRALCAQGLSIIPHTGALDAPAAPRFESVDDDLVSQFRKSTQFYITGPFTQFPIRFKQLKTGPKAGKYLIDESSADSLLLQASIARVNLVDGKPRLIWGNIILQKTYRDSSTGEWRRPSEELREAYKRVVTLVKKKAKRYVAGVPIRIAPGALALFERGEAHIARGDVIPPVTGAHGFSSDRVKVLFDALAKAEPIEKALVRGVRAVRIEGQGSTQISPLSALEYAELRVHFPTLAVFAEADLEGPGATRGDGDGMSYAVIRPPFALDFNRMSEAQLDRYCEWFLNVIPERIAQLSALVHQSPTYVSWVADESPASLELLGHWFAAHAETQASTKDDGDALTGKFTIGGTGKELTKQTFSLATDVGMYLGHVFLKNVPGARWQQERGRTGNYGRMVIQGMGAMASNPIAMVMAHVLIGGDVKKLRKLYDRCVKSRG